MFTKAIIVFIGSLALCEGLLLDCTYSVKTVWIEPFYHCEARVIFIGHIRNVTDVSTNHLQGYNNLNVASISIWNQNVKLPPRNIEEFFPNLALYSLRATETEVIHPDDINKFPQLQYYLVQNCPKVIIVPPNMFANNPMLKGVAFNGNGIQHVAYNVFDHLANLYLLYVQGPCIDLSVQNRADVISSLFNIFRSCPPTLGMLHDQLSEYNRRC